MFDLIVSFVKISYKFEKLLFFQSENKINTWLPSLREQRHSGCVSSKYFWQILFYSSSFCLMSVSFLVKGQDDKLCDFLCVCKIWNRKKNWFWFDDWWRVTIMDTIELLLPVFTQCLCCNRIVLFGGDWVGGGGGGWFAKFVC